MAILDVYKSKGWNKGDSPFSSTETGLERNKRISKITTDINKQRNQKESLKQSKEKYNADLDKYNTEYKNALDKYYEDVANYEAYQQELIANEREQEHLQRKIDNASTQQRLGGTLSDIGLTLYESIIKGGEGVVDFLASLFGPSTQDFVATNKTDQLMTQLNQGIKLSNIMNQSYEIPDPSYSYVKDDSIAQGVIQGVGQMIPNIAISTIPGAGVPLSLGYLGLSAGGNAVEEAYSEDANYTQALLYGAASGAIEIATEKISNILGPAKKAFGKGIFDNGLSKVFNSSAGKLIIGMAGEGFEELLSEAANPLAKYLIYQESQGKELDFASGADLVNAFTIGALTSGVLALPSNIYNIRKYGNNQIIEGLELASETEKARLDFENKTNTLYSIDQLNEYQSNMANATKMIEDGIKKMPLDKQMTIIGNNSDNPFFQDFNVVTGKMDTLNTTFEYDSKVGGIQYADTSHNIVYDIKQDLSPESKVKIEESARLFNTLNVVSGKTRKIVFTDNETIFTKGNKETGYYDPKNQTLYIRAIDSLDSIKPIKYTVGHEFTHSLEGTKSYGLFYDLVTKELSKNKSLRSELGITSWNELVNKRSKDYAFAKEGRTSDEFKQYVQEEILADVVGEHILTDKAFVDSLVKENKTTAQKIKTWISNAIKKLRGIKVTDKNEVEVTKLREFLNKAEALYKEALVDTAKTEASDKTRKSIDVEETISLNIKLKEDTLGNKLSKKQIARYNDLDKNMYDEKGRLKVLYHGSRARFNIFLTDKGGQSNGLAKIGFWFTENKQGAYNFADSVWYGKRENPIVYETYLNIKNPLIYESTPKDTKAINNLVKINDSLYNKMHDITDHLDWFENSLLYDVVRGVDVEYVNNRINDFKKNGLITDNDIPKLNETIKEYKKLKVQLDKNQNTIMELSFTDAYEKFKTDFYKSIGLNAEDANIGGRGRAFFNKPNAIEDYKQSLIDKGYDSIIIKSTSYDGSILGNDNNQYIVFNSNQIKKITNKNPTNNDDIRYSVETPDDSSKTEETKSTEKSKDTKDSKNLNTTRNVVDSYFNQEMMDRLNTESLVYEVEPDKAAIEKSKKDLFHKPVTSQINEIIELLNGNKRIYKNDIVRAYLVMQNAYKKGYYAEVVDIASSISMVLTDAGKTVQAGNLIKRLTPEGKLMTFNRLKGKIAERNAKTKISKKAATRLDEFMEKTYKADTKFIKGLSVESVLRSHDITNDKTINTIKTKISALDNLTVENVGAIINSDLSGIENTAAIINEIVEKHNQLRTDLDKQYDNGAVIIPMALQNRLLKATNDSEIKATIKEITIAMNSQKKIGFFEKIQQWRYLAMLFNVKTHLRNIISNTLMYEVARTKVYVQAGIEKTFKVKERTATIRKASYIMTSYARSIAVETFESLSDNVSKYNAMAKGTTVFDTKWLEYIRKLNNNLLENVEDRSAFERMFTFRFSNWATANNYTTEFLKKNPDIVEKGKDIALQEALEVTFKDFSGFASFLNRVKSLNRFSELFVSSIVPFTKTPINIAKRGLEYSPLGLMKSTFDGFTKVKNGKMSATQWINNMSKGLTGTMIALLGVLLANLGLVSGDDDDETTKESTYNASLGKKPFTLIIDDKSYSLDWLAPASIPFFIGVAIYEASPKENASGELDFKAYADAILSTLNPMTEMTMLQSINQALNSYDDNNITGVFSNAFQSFVGSFFPSITSQIAKTISPTRRTTQTTKSSDYSINYLINKVPFLADTLQPYTNVWGQEEDDKDLMKRMMENIIYPFWIYTDKGNNPVDKELIRLYDISNNNEILPTVPKYYYTEDNQRYEMEAEEYTQFKMDYGTFSFNSLQALFNSSFYKDLSDEEKESAINKVYSLARDYAKKGTIYTLNVALNNKSDYLANYLINVNSIEGVKDSYGKTINGSKKKMIFTYINVQKLSKIQKSILFSYVGYPDDSNDEDIYYYLKTLDLSQDQIEQFMTELGYSYLS